jgi:glycosyltransferase involved in cell wall biosynthesis
MPDAKKLKVWFISSWYPTRVHDTRGNFVARHAEAVAGYAQVCVLHVSSDPALKRGRELTEKHSGDLTEYILYLPASRRKFPLFSALIRYLRFRKAYDYLASVAESKSGKPDLIHTNVFYPFTIFGSGLASRYGIPYVVSEHWTAYLPGDPVQIRGRALGLCRRLAAKAACIMPVSQHLAAAMQKLGLKGRYQVVSNVVDTDVFAPAEDDTRGEVFRFLHVSTLHHEQKNFDGLLRIMGQLKDKRQDFILDVISDGSIEPYIKLIEEYGLRDFIRFHGKMDAAEVAQRMKQADALLLFSRYENFPCVIPEAWACGTPVISTDVGGIAEHLTDDLGILVPEGDENAFLSGLEELLTGNRSFDPQRLRQYALSHFSLQVIGNEFVRIYQNVLQERV